MSIDDEIRSYVSPANGNGDWPLWRRLVVGHIERQQAEIVELQKEVKVLHRARETHRLDIAEMKLKIGMASLVVSMVVAGAVSWVAAKL